MAGTVPVRQLLWLHTASPSVGYEDFDSVVLADRRRAVGEPVPSTAVLDRRVWPRRFVQVGMAVVGVSGDETVRYPPGQRLSLIPSREAISAFVNIPLSRSRS